MSENPASDLIAYADARITQLTVLEQDAVDPALVRMLSGIIEDHGLGLAMERFNDEPHVTSDRGDGVRLHERVHRICSQVGVAYVLEWLIDEVAVNNVTFVP